jgi:hypothetical protein
MGSKGMEATQQESENAVDYKGYMIRPTCRRQGSQWLTAGVISKRFEDQTKEHHFIRADTHSSKDDADSCSIDKAKRIIDEQGERLFQKG